MNKDFVRAAHYFADGWALNMWQVAEPKQMRSDLRQIRLDGFNTIIVLVPWRGFQTDHLVPRYDVFYVSQLQRLLKAAGQEKLQVIVRASYLHHCLEQNVPSAFAMVGRLREDPATMNAWLDYLRFLHKVCSGYRSFRQAFISWEEFWGSFIKLQRYKLSRRERLMEPTGFAQYLRDEGITGINAIPESNDEHYLAFINQSVRQLIEAASEVFPGISAEFRVDLDPVEGPEGPIWRANDNYADWPTTRYSYWAPFMGADNEGELLSSERSLELLRYMMGLVTAQGQNCDHIIDQFNFVDDTASYKDVHAQIEPAEVNKFLEGAAPVLKKFSAGYGVWAYQDYRQNILYNPKFLMGLSGWHVVNGTTSALGRDKPGIRLSRDAILRQTLPAPVAGLQRAIPFTEFQLQARGLNEKSKLEIRINAGLWQAIEISEQSNLGCATLPVDYGQVWDDGLLIEIRNTGPKTCLTGLVLYHTVFQSGIRDCSGSEGPHLAGLRLFNKKLGAAG
jgi:hypothetical protein